MDESMLVKIALGAIAVLGALLAIALATRWLVGTD